MQFRFVGRNCLFGSGGVLMIGLGRLQRLFVGLQLLLVRLNGLLAGAAIRIGSKNRRGDQSDGEHGNEFVHDASFWCGVMVGFGYRLTPKNWSVLPMLGMLIGEE